MVPTTSSNTDREIGVVVAVAVDEVYLPTDRMISEALTGAAPKATRE